MTCTGRRNGELARKSELLRNCEEELEHIKRRNIFLYDKIQSKLTVCRNGHIHITLLVAGLIKTRYVVTNEEEFLVMHHENKTLIKDLIEDTDLITSSSKVEDIE